MIKGSVERCAMENHDIIVMGASAGGVEAYTEILSALPADLRAVVFLVLHMPPNGSYTLPKVLSRGGPLPASFAVDGEPIQYSHVYIAPPDRHMLVGHGVVRLGEGPLEKRSRPAVDPLFRSAAKVYGKRTVGVILTGLLDDGAAGLRAVQTSGGIAVIQDPDDAAYPGMPLSAKNQVKADYILSVAEIGPLLVRLAGREELGYGLIRAERKVIDVDPDLILPAIPGRAATREG